MYDGCQCSVVVGPCLMQLANTKVNLITTAGQLDCNQGNHCEYTILRIDYPNTLLSRLNLIRWIQIIGFQL